MTTLFLHVHILRLARWAFRHMIGGRDGRAGLAHSRWLRSQRSAAAIPRWLRGGAWASPHGSSVRVNLENNAGTRAEVYLTTKQARELRESLDWILTNG